MRGKDTETAKTSENVFRSLLMVLTLLVPGLDATGQGFFQSPTFQPLPQTFGQPLHHEIVVADFNGDGLNDILVQGDGLIPGFQPQVGFHCMLQQAGGGFLAPVFSASPGDLLAITDMDDDGLSDILVSSGEFLHSNGTGGFTLAGAALNANPLVAGDLDNDGIPEIMAIRLPPSLPTALVQSPVDVWAWRPDMGNWAVVAGLPNDFRQSSIVGLIADVDGDGWRDVILGGQALSGGLRFASQTAKSGEVFVHKNLSGSMSFSQTGPLDPIQALPGSAWSVGDVNLDGCDDFVSSAPPSLLTSVLGNQATLIGARIDSVACTSILSCQQLGPAFNRFHIRDINTDGFPDLVKSHPYFINALPLVWKMAIRVYAGRGDGRFSLPLVEDEPLLFIGAPTSPNSFLKTARGVGDLDGDGDPDLVFVVGDPNLTASRWGIAWNDAILGPGSRSTTGELRCEVRGRLASDVNAFGIDLAGALSGQQATLVVSLGAAPLSLAGATWWPDLAAGPLLLPGLQASTFTTDSQGHAQVSFGLPLSLQGLELFAQWLVTDPAGPLLAGTARVALSSARKIVVW